MLRITPLMNSSCEEVFGFKTCCGAKTFDQNLEIHLKNTGTETIGVHSRFEIVGAHGTKTIDNLMPQGILKIPPGQIKAFYVYMDQVLWENSSKMKFFDEKGKLYDVAINREKGS